MDFYWDVLAPTHQKQVSMFYCTVPYGTVPYRTVPRQDPYNERKGPAAETILWPPLYMSNSTLLTNSTVE